MFLLLRYLLQPIIYPDQKRVDPYFSRDKDKAIKRRLALYK